MTLADRIHGRAVLAGVAIVPLLTVGLVGCQAGGDSGTRPKSTKGGTGQSTASAKPTGGLPFVDPSVEPSTEPSGTPSASSTAAPTSAPSGAGGSDTVKWDGNDLSSVNWQVDCYLGDSPSFYGRDADQSAASANGATFMVTTNEQGEVDWLMASPGGESLDALYFSRSTDPADTHGKAEISFDGKTATLSGEAYSLLDYSYDKPLKFEMRITCDSTY